MSEEECKLNINTTPREENSEKISTLSEKEFERKNYWKSCCIQVDRRAVKFFSQLIISLLIIVFCLFQLHYVPKCDSSEYLSLLTMILGVWVTDAPRLHNN